MKIQVLSDLHYEFNEGYYLKKEHFVGDVIVLAGDICSLPDHRFADLPDVPVIHVLGNHEHYGKNFVDTKRKTEDAWLRLGKENVSVLNNQVRVEDGVRFLCTTLWTDFLTEDKMYQMAECKRGMNDFYQIRNFTTATWIYENDVAVTWLKQELAKEHEGKTVVVTHHAPSFKSNGEWYRNSSIRAGFCTDMEYLMKEEKIDLWIHGHTHEPADYMVGSTRVVCNPLGYRAENPRFQESLVVEI